MVTLREGDTIEIDIPGRKIGVALSDDELERRRQAMEAKGTAAWKPVNRERFVSQALQAYAAMTTSAANRLSASRRTPKWTPSAQT